MNFDGTQLERLREQRDEALHDLEMMRGQRWFWLVAGVVIGWVLF
jgi:hypothetical protein